MLEQFNLIERLKEQLRKKWTFNDVLLERYLWSSRSATSAQGQGRDLEDQIEEIRKEPRSILQYAGKICGPWRKYGSF